MTFHYTFYYINTTKKNVLFLEFHRKMFRFEIKRKKNTLEISSIIDIILLNYIRSNELIFFTFTQFDFYFVSSICRPIS
jgi:hypothetical protein